MKSQCRYYDCFSLLHAMDCHGLVAYLLNNSDTISGFSESVTTTIEDLVTRSARSHLRSFCKRESHSALLCCDTSLQRADLSCPYYDQNQCPSRVSLHPYWGGLHRWHQTSHTWREGWKFVRQSNDYVMVVLWSYERAGYMSYVRGIQNINKWVWTAR